jgi:hypothetical protein
MLREHVPGDPVIEIGRCGSLPASSPISTCSLRVEPGIDLVD